MRILMTLLVLMPTSLTMAAQAATAQSPNPNTPRPAHERLAVFEGTWRNADSAEADVFVEVCGWLEGGRRHMVCNPRWTRPSGLVQHQTIYSYRGRDSTYVVTTFLATGPVWTYHGRPDGNRWVFDLHSERADTAQRLRAILTVAGDTIHFVEESSENGGPWRVTEDYRHIRVPRVP
ncbi:hypothetical protein BH23GEM9_BH23GEM9_37700 [soil metagenome]